MRLASATCLVALALTGAACQTAATRSNADKELAAKLRELGIEGKTYTNDLGQVASIHLGRVWNVDNDLLIEDIHGHLTYLDGATLNPKWEYYGMSAPFDRAPDSTPSAIIGVSKGRIYVVSRGNGTDDVDPRAVDVVASGAPVANDQTIYVPTWPTPSGNKTVYAISLASGYVGWGYRSNADVVGGMAKGGPGGGDTFYFATSDGILSAFPTYMATERSPDIGWQTNLHGAVTNDLTVDGNDIAVVMTDGRLVCVDRLTGAVRWEAYTGSHETAEGSATFSPKHDVPGPGPKMQAGGYVFYRAGGELRAYDRDTGTKAWGVRGATAFIAERGGRMLLAAGKNEVVSVDKKTGKVLGRANTGGWIFPRRAVADATIFAISPNGMVVSVENGF